MSYRKVYLEWAIDEDSLLDGVPVGFEVEFSRDKHFHQITTTLTTFNETDPYGAYQFWYSLDEGITWTQYPWGDQGYTFTSPFRMRLEINPSNLGYNLSLHNGVLKKISADSKEIIDSATLTFEDNIIDADQYEDVLYLIGANTLYKIDGLTMEPSNNSLPLLTDKVIGVISDESRKNLWQINKTSVWLRNVYGDILWDVSIPEIYGAISSSSSWDISETSSSSSSSISESSSSSSSESSESVGNNSSSSSSTSSSSESSLDIPSMYATGFNAYPELQGTYYGISSLDGYYIYKNDNGCILQHDPYGTTRWKLYIDETHRSLARDHYYKNSETVNPYADGPDNYSIHMWWDIAGIPLTGTIGTISDTP